MHLEYVTVIYHAHNEFLKSYPAYTTLITNFGNDAGADAISWSIDLIQPYILLFN